MRAGGTYTIFFGNVFRSIQNTMLRRSNRGESLLGMLGRSIYSKKCTRCCFPPTNMIQVCDDFQCARVFITHTRPNEIHADIPSTCPSPSPHPNPHANHSSTNQIHTPFFNDSYPHTPCLKNSYRHSHRAPSLPPALSAGSDRLFQVLDLYWRSPKSGDVR